MPAKKGKGSGGRGGGQDSAAVSILVQEIIGRYAARDDADKIRRCGRRNDENPEEHWRWAGNDGKPVMKDEQAAKECSRQLEVARRKPHHAYLCPRSKSGHWHVAAGRLGGRPSKRHPERLAAA